MSIQRSILTGYANGDVHSAWITHGEEPSAAAAREMTGIGQLTNEGFRVLVASAWSNDEKRTAGVNFAAIWQENEALIIVKHGDRVATSMELYGRMVNPGDQPLTCQELMEICQRLKRP